MASGNCGDPYPVFWYFDGAPPIPLPQPANFKPANFKRTKGSISISFKDELRQEIDKWLGGS